MKFKKGDLVWLKGHEGNPHYLVTIVGPNRYFGYGERVYSVLMGNEHGECGEESMVELSALDRLVYA